MPTRTPSASFGKAHRNSGQTNERQQKKKTALRSKEKPRNGKPFTLYRRQPNQPCNTSTRCTSPKLSSADALSTRGRPPKGGNADQLALTLGTGRLQNLCNPDAPTDRRKHLAPQRTNTYPKGDFPSRWTYCETEERAHPRISSNPTLSTPFFA